MLFDARSLSAKRFHRAQSLRAIARCGSHSLTRMRPSAMNRLCFDELAMTNAKGSSRAHRRTASIAVSSARRTLRRSRRETCRASNTAPAAAHGTTVALQIRTIPAAAAVDVTCCEHCTNDPTVIIGHFSLGRSRASRRNGLRAAEPYPATGAQDAALQRRSYPGTRCAIAAVSNAPCGLD